MSMKVTKLYTYWDAGDAQLVISFLDDLRDLLWEVYGEEIIEMHQTLADEKKQHDSPDDSPFDDQIEF